MYLMDVQCRKRLSFLTSMLDAVLRHEELLHSRGRYRGHYTLQYNPPLDSQSIIRNLKRSAKYIRNFYLMTDLNLLSFILW